jgi:hypothetical protein
MILIVCYALSGVMKIEYICFFNVISAVGFGIIYRSIGMEMEIQIYRRLFLMLEGALDILSSWKC